MVVRHARGARAVVIARPERHETQYAHDCLHAALFDAGAPTLIVPPRHSAPFGRVVAIAWQDDDRAAKAVRTSLPILKAADAVHVLHAGGPATIPAILQQHGVKAEVCTVRAESGSTGRALLQAAHRCGADLMVMGAYAHGEWRERVFGGVTRTMLAEADLPLLLRH
ncbi:MAG TPA: universal stress protein [Rhodopila sp.]|nr:universal stress protein [Rhodopila sp.]